ncbi:hypothetical protein [Geobacter sulfurreducens]|uniref:hypothetical protein n=1 Tax=Geobacter sulfurreducens TaxID=35554 RepID=UPI000DBB4DA9|nr:hypothetical protein [Geobacter sulfurreducens]BBA71744.1 hypothetical protein YM18_3236 [Geobacter sulfurreducens]
MECVFDRRDYPELAEQAEKAAGEIRREIMELRDQLTATLTPEQRAVFTKLDDLTVAEGAEIQDATARALCGCPKCKALAA